MRILKSLLITLIMTLLAAPAFAAPLRVFVTDINAIGVQNRDETKMILQTLLASRMSNDKVIAVGSAAEADAIVSGTYIVIGKVFSMDAMARTSSGRTITRTFIQGDASEELISSVTKLADKISTELSQKYAAQIALPEAAPLAQRTSSDLIVRNSNLRDAPRGDIIRQQDLIRGSNGKGWISKRLSGAANLLAIGATSKSGERDIFLAQNNRFEYFRQGEVLKRLDGKALRPDEKIISLDSIDADGDGKPELYVTIVRNDEPASQVWEIRGDKLVKIANDLPYFFRTIAVAGGKKKLYAQEMGRGEENFYGDVYEAERSGSKVTLKTAIKLPRFGNIFSFNQFHDRDGNLLTIVINPDNYLIVYNSENKEIWRSNERYTDTALYYQKEDPNNVRTTGDKYRYIFMNQRIQVTSKNEILLGKNEGLFVVGNMRLYKKGSVYNMTWDGSSLEEVWRTKETHSYMPDFWYDEARNELLLLQMPLKPGPGEDGAASLAIKKVE